MTQPTLFDAEPEIKPDLPGWPCAFSHDRVYRYVLWRLWANHAAPRHCTFIGLNPSTADEAADDPTIRRCVAFAKSWGYDGLAMLNLFAFRATDPKVMVAHEDPIGDQNDKWIVDIAADAEMVLASWGCHGSHRRRDYEVRLLLDNIKKPLCVLKLNKDGSPLHPLYAKGDLHPVEWTREPDTGKDA